MKTEHDFTYCPHCGSSLKKTESNLLVCTSCDLHYYINPKVCNAVILENEKNEILFVKRKHNPHKGLWDLPGGFVDLGETLESSVHRELMEELHVTIEEIHYIGSIHDSYEFGGITFQTICALFLGKIDSHTEIQVDDDAEAYAFFKKDALIYKEIAFEGIQEALKKYVTTTT